MNVFLRNIIFFLQALDNVIKLIGFQTDSGNINWKRNWFYTDIEPGTDSRKNVGPDFFIQHADKTVLLCNRNKYSRRSNWAVFLYPAAEDLRPDHVAGGRRILRLKPDFEFPGIECLLHLWSNFCFQVCLFDILFCKGCISILYGRNIVIHTKRSLVHCSGKSYSSRCNSYSKMHCNREGHMQRSVIKNLAGLQSLKIINRVFHADNKGAAAKSCDKSLISDNLT